MRNIGASVKQRLLNLSRTDNRPYNELLQLYAMERFLYRLSLSTYQSEFILKGAILLRVWGLSNYRPTMDIDMLGQTYHDEAELLNVIRDIATMSVVDDGVMLDTSAITAQPITIDSQYHGSRIMVSGKLDSARFRFHVDIGFGDIVTPPTTRQQLPSLLEFPAIELLCYSKETAIAEKYEAMVKLGMSNSRMKDFYDIWILCATNHFDGFTLSSAIKRTFDRRNTTLTSQPDAFTDAFIERHQNYWEAYVKRIGQESVPLDFAVVMADIAHFLVPAVTGLATGKPFVCSWSHGEWH